MWLWDADVVFAKTFELAVCKSMKIKQSQKSEIEIKGNYKNLRTNVPMQPDPYYCNN